MIAHLCGEPARIGDKWAVIDVNGIGYQVYLPQPELGRLKGMSGKVRIYTHTAVREDGISLYGFLRQSELELFTMLISVSGIGPQIALSIISQVEIEDFAIAILNEDEKTLTRIPGIGPKSAKRLILELRDKMKKAGASLITGEKGRGSAASHDAVSALISLGFPESPARDAVSTAAAQLGNPDLEALIKTALGILKSHG